MFLIRKPIRNENDLHVTLERASREFILNDLEKAASELNMLQGTLSRYLLPFNNKTSVVIKLQITIMSLVLANLMVY